MGKNRLEKSGRDNIHNQIKRERRERMEKRGEERESRKKEARKLNGEQKKDGCVCECVCV